MLQYNHLVYSSKVLKKQVCKYSNSINQVYMLTKSYCENISMRPKMIILTEMVQNTNTLDITDLDINRIKEIFTKSDTKLCLHKSH